MDLLKGMNWTWIHWNRTWIWWPEHWSIEMEHGSGERNMDLVVPFEMEHGSQILKKDGLDVIHSVRPAVVHSFQRVPRRSLFLNRPMHSSGVQSLIFPIAIFVAFVVQTLMQVTLLWPDPWPMSDCGTCFWWHRQLLPVLSTWRDKPRCVECLNTLTIAQQHFILKQDVHVREGREFENQNFDMLFLLGIFVIANKILWLFCLWKSVSDILICESSLLDLLTLNGLTIKKCSSTYMRVSVRSTV